MQVEKIITEKQELNITGAILLSKEEFEQCKNLIPYIKDIWWLRSPGRYHDEVVCGGCRDIVTACDFTVGMPHAVRPALTILNLESSNFQVGDKFKFANHIFTIINEKYALCNDTIGECRFKGNYVKEDANDYEISDVKQYIDEWFNKARS